jgi:hypothetical protein
VDDFEPAMTESA